MDLNKYTKAELISKLESKIDSNKSKIDLNKTKDKSPTIMEVIIKFKGWLLSLTFIANLMKVFKNYKSIRAFLKLANYVIWTMFGYSIMEAFGLSFILKLFVELKYIFGAIVVYLTDSTFYRYLTRVFNVVEEEEKPSVRAGY